MSLTGHNLRRRKLQIARQTHDKSVSGEINEPEADNTSHEFNTETESVNNVNNEESVKAEAYEEGITHKKRGRPARE